MISPGLFYRELEKAGISYFTGVPDSLLKSLCACLSDNTAPGGHIIAASEGGAVGLAIGYHLATGEIPLVYMQNSGLGNVINPLTSLVDPMVYSIPMLLLIGWRGEPGQKDEPQHLKQGPVTLPLLDALGVPWTIFAGDESDIGHIIQQAVVSARERDGAHALVIRKGCFGDYSGKLQQHSNFGWRREDAIRIIVDHLRPDDIVVSTTGMASRELFQHREVMGHSHEQDFLTVGGMGYASQIALGVAAQKPRRRVICIDGDGAALMQLGSLAINGVAKLDNFKHIIINNGSFDSVGGQPTVAFDINLVQIATACGYASSTSCETAQTFAQLLGKRPYDNCPSMIEVRVDRGSSENLGRPTIDPIRGKQAFMKFVRD